MSATVTVHLHLVSQNSKELLYKQILVGVVPIGILYNSIAPMESHKRPTST